MIRILGIIVNFLIISTFCFGQTSKQVESVDSVKEESKEVFYQIDKIPEFPGGMGEFYKYLFKNIKYPKDAKKQGIKGKVFVQFVIDSTGYVIKDEVRIHESLFKSCDEEAIRLIQECPKWIPGFSNKLNKNVPVRMIIPIAFNR